MSTKIDPNAARIFGVRGFAASEYLRDEADIAAYLEAATAEEDPRILAAALGDVARTNQLKPGTESLMIALAVYLNRKKLVVAGSDDLCVLNAIVNAVGELGKLTVPIGERGKPDLWLSVSGLTSRPDGAEDEHLRWIGHRRLRVGDKITVQLVKTDRPDRHRSSTVATRDRRVAKPKRKPRKGKPARRARR